MEIASPKPLQLFQDHNKSDREFEEDHMDNELAELRAGMDKIMSLLSKLKESSPNPN